jgi:ribose 5-phosphate isomerase B
MEWLRAKGFEVKDLGCFNEESCDYPDYAAKVAKAVAKEKNSFGFLVCGTGIGMNIAANKIKGVRAALCASEEMAKAAREHNDANVLVLGARTTSEEKAKRITEIFFSTKFSGGERHARRVKKLNSL